MCLFLFLRGSLLNQRGERGNPYVMNLFILQSSLRRDKGARVMQSFGSGSCCWEGCIWFSFLPVSRSDHIRQDLVNSQLEEQHAYVDLSDFILAISPAQGSPPPSLSLLFIDTLATSYPKSIGSQEKCLKSVLISNYTVGSWSQM